MNSPHDWPIKLSVILPCRNEEESLAACLEQIQKILAANNISGEIIVSDSSSDRSPQIAEHYGARLVKHDKPGYGTAYQEGLGAARGRYLFLADCDGTYDFAEIPNFLQALENCDLAIGNRFSGRMNKSAMPWANRYIGNPLLSGLLRLISGAPVTDAHSGMRAISRQALDRLELKSSGMEFASEMILEAVRKNLKIKEIPIVYYPRQGRSKLRPLIDGGRHLRLMFLYLIKDR